LLRAFEVSVDAAKREMREEVAFRGNGFGTHSFPLILGGKNPPNVHEPPVRAGFDSHATLKVELESFGDPT
jgi:hypothetical protein